MNNILIIIRIDLIGCCVVEDDGLTKEEYEVEKILKLIIIIIMQ